MGWALLWGPLGIREVRSAQPGLPESGDPLLEEEKKKGLGRGLLLCRCEDPSGSGMILCTEDVYALLMSAA